jgi:integrase
MKKTCSSSPRNRARIRTIKAGFAHVKIYSGAIRRRPSFTVYWRIAEKPYRKVFLNANKAESFAREQAERLAAGQANAPAISVTEAQTFREAQRRLGPVEVPLHVVAGEYADIVRHLGDNGTLRQAVEFFLHNAVRPDLIRTIPQVVAEFIETKRADGLSKVYIEDCTWRLRRFARDFHTPISHICTRDMEDWLRKLTVSLATRNDFRRLIITLFNFARRRGYLPRDRETEARWLEKPKIKSKPIQIFTPQELNELLAVAEGQARLAIVIGAFTGIRSAEMLRLNWENFNWEEGVIDIGCDQTKTASRRLVPILEPLMAWIRSFVKRHGPVLEYSLPVCLAEAFATTAKKADAARKESEADAPEFRWKANGLRHSYASYRLATENDVAKVSLEMGNSPQKVFSNYRKVVTKNQANAWFGVLPEVPSNVVPLAIAV